MGNDRRHDVKSAVRTFIDETSQYWKKTPWSTIACDALLHPYFGVFGVLKNMSAGPDRFNALSLPFYIAETDKETIYNVLQGGDFFSGFEANKPLGAVGMFLLYFSTFPIRSMLKKSFSNQIYGTISPMLGSKASLLPKKQLINVIPTIVVFPLMKLTKQFFAGHRASMKNTFSGLPLYVFSIELYRSTYRFVFPLIEENFSLPQFMLKPLIRLVNAWYIVPAKKELESKHSSDFKKFRLDDDIKFRISTRFMNLILFSPLLRAAFFPLVNIACMQMIEDTHSFKSEQGNFPLLNGIIFEWFLIIICESRVYYTFVKYQIEKIYQKQKRQKKKNKEKKKHRESRSELRA